MKISIITVSYNSADTIEETIQSVLSQKGIDLEYVIVDGGSSDCTLDIVEKYKNKISKVISEPDEGVYYAMNKGIGMVSGDVVGILNSDDTYTDDRTLSKVMDRFENSNIDSCYGDLSYVDRDNSKQITRYWKSEKFSDDLLSKGWYPAHPTFFVKRSVYEQVGVFDTQFSIAADADLMLRVFFKHKLKSDYIPEVLVLMKTGGTSSKNTSVIIKQNMEIIRSIKKLGLNVSIFKFCSNKLTSRMMQILRKLSVDSN